jgi:subfamily B ATP-binding cassette protein MsbA
VTRVRVDPTTRRLLGLLRPHAVRLLVAAGLLVATGAVPGVTVLLLRQVLDDALARHDAARLARVPVAIVGLYAAHGAATLTRAWITRSVTWDVARELRARLHDHLLRLDVAWHGQAHSGALGDLLGPEVDSVQIAVSGVVTAIQKPVSIAGLVAAAAWMDPAMALAALGAVPLAAVPIAWFGQRARARARAAAEARATLASTVLDTLRGIRTVVLLGGEGARTEAFRTANERHGRAARDAVLAQSVASPATEFLVACALAVLVWFGGQRVLDGTLEPGRLVAFLVALTMLNEPLKGLAQVHGMFARAHAGAARVFAVLDTVPGIDEGAVGRVPRPSSSPPTPARRRPTRIDVEDVTFGYDPETPVLRGVTLHAGVGERVAIVGASGAGKSTLLDLLARLHDPSAGAIRWDGVDLRTLPRAAVRRAIAAVGQDAWLFDGSLADNLALGVGATREDAWRAMDAVGLAGWARALPHGLDTRVQEAGVRLSGGQRQRVCIARALLRDAPVLLLDEPTANLDAESEQVVREGLERLARGRTVFLAAHRLSTVHDADRIIVLEGGGVQETGTHPELLSAGGTYARLVARQVVV